MNVGKRTARGGKGMSEEPVMTSIFIPPMATDLYDCDIGTLAVSHCIREWYN